MTGLLRPRRLIIVALLTLVWCGLWRDVSIANLAAGFAIAVLVTVTGIGMPLRGGVRPWPLLRFTALVVVDLIKSTVEVAVEIITRDVHPNEAVIAVDVPPTGRDHLLLLTVAITLTPGTAVVDADRDEGVLYLHLLHHERRAKTVAHVKELIELACEALPTKPIGAAT